MLYHLLYILDNKVMRDAYYFLQKSYTFILHYVNNIVLHVILRVRGAHQRKGAYICLMFWNVFV